MELVDSHGGMHHGYCLGRGACTCRVVCARRGQAQVKITPAGLASSTVNEQVTSRRFPVTVTHLPVTRCQICRRTVAYRPGTLSEVLTEHYRRAAPRSARPRFPVPAAELPLSAGTVARCGFRSSRGNLGQQSVTATSPRPHMPRRVSGCHGGAWSACLLEAMGGRHADAGVRVRVTTRHPVSHDTALPDRLAPYTSAYPIPPRSSSWPNAARRRRISDTENPGFPSTDTLRCWTTGRPARNRTARPALLQARAGGRVPGFQWL